MTRAGIVAAFLTAALLMAMPARSQSKEPSPELAGLREIVANFYRTGAYDEALEASERALTLAMREFGAEHEQIAIQSYSAGLVAERAGRLADAERYYRQSVAIREKVYGAESAGTAQALELLGGVLMRKGELQAAEPVFKRVLAIRGDLVGADHAFTASARAALGSVAIERGDTATALAQYRQAVQSLVGQKVEQTLARHVVDEEIRRLRPVFAGLAHADWQAAANGTLPREAALEESFAASQQAWTTSAAGALARMSARLAVADTDLGRRIRASQDAAERVLALHEEDMKALSEWGSVQRADPGYRAALDAFRQRSIDSSRDNAPAIKRQRELVAALQAELQRCPPGQPKTGCDDKEREAITRELSQLAAGMAKGSAGIMELNQRLQEAEKKLPGQAAFAAARSARLDESQRLERGLITDRAEIAKLFPDYIALIQPKPLAIADVGQLLGANEALISILVGPDRSFVWAISRERAGWAEIDAGADALAGRVATLREGLDPAAGDAASAGITGSYDLAAAHAAYNLLLAPVAAVVEGKSHLMIVPTGPLTSLPFHVLLTGAPPTGTSTAEAYRRAPWLIRRHSLSVLPSVQSLAALRRLAPAAEPPKPFLGIGDPVLVGPAGRTPVARGGRPDAPQPAAFYRGGQVDTRALRELVPLPETALELKAVARLLKAGPEALLLGPTATETRFKALPLRDYRILHFATHGLVSGELSGTNEPALVLTPPDRPSAIDDGLLTASEVAGLTLAADWVVLSACNTASGSDSGADALSGLARAFFYAGARGLLVSHWAVNSRAAVLLTTRTFQRLAADRKIGRAEAFRRTMLELIDDGAPPSHWAPFVVVGEGGSR